MIRTYLEYLETNLGISGVMLSPELITTAHSIEDAGLVEAEKLVNDSLRMVKVDQGVATEAWTPISSEVTFKLGVPYQLIFLRVNDYRQSLGEDLDSAELLSKLRSAIGFDATSAPWVETSLGSWLAAKNALALQAPRVLLMLDDQLVKSELNDGFGVIPDPAELIANVALKRPTWEYLKDWK